MAKKPKNINPLNERQLTKLTESLEWSRRRLEPFRNNYTWAIDQYVGARYGSGGRQGSTPYNLMELAINIYQRQLASNNPAVHVSAQKTTNKPAAQELTVALNHLIQRMELWKVLNDAVYNALFCWGIVKVGITEPEGRPLKGFNKASGQPFAQSIGVDDWVHDTNAKRIEECDFLGNAYSMRKRDVLENDLFNDAAKREISKQDDRSDISLVRRGDDQTPSTLSYDTESVDPPELHDRVWLWDLWLPAEKLLVTIPAGGIMKPLRVVEWDGPERGPFHFLSFMNVPGNIIGLAPAQVWADMTELCNTLTVKLGHQADRQKKNVLVYAGAQADGKALRDADDGEIITTTSPPGESFQEISTGGIAQENLAALLQFADMLKASAGNLDAIGGLGTSAETLGQDQLISSASNQRMQDMQAKVVNFTRDISRDLAWYLWDDPLIDLPLTKKIPGVSDPIPFTWNKDNRDGEFFDYEFDIEPFSLRARSPAEKLQAMVQTLNTVVMPFLPLMQQEGLTVDMEGLIDIIAQYSSMPELTEIIKRGGVSLRQENEQEEEMTSKMTPQKTSREYVKRTAPEDPGAKTSERMQSLLGAAGGGKTPNRGAESG